MLVQVLRDWDGTGNEEASCARMRRKIHLSYCMDGQKVHGLAGTCGQRQTRSRMVGTATLYIALSAYQRADRVAGYTYASELRSRSLKIFGFSMTARAARILRVRSSRSRSYHLGVCVARRNRVRGSAPPRGERTRGCASACRHPSMRPCRDGERRRLLLPERTKRSRGAVWCGIPPGTGRGGVAVM
jgi:hypothetical protein